MESRFLRGLCCFLFLAGLSLSGLVAINNAERQPADAAAYRDAPPDDEPEAIPQGGGPQALSLQTGVPGEEPPDGSSPDVMAGQPTAVAPSAVPSAGAPGSEMSELRPLGAQGSWRLILDEEFDALNSAVWTPYWFRDCDPGSRKNNVKTCSRNVEVADGEAILRLSDSDSGALLSSNPRDGLPGHIGFEFTTGYAEARIFFPGTCSGGIYNWPAWWTVGQFYPHSGEIDIAEPLRGDMTTVYHAADYHRAQWVFGCWAGRYHTYGVNRLAGRNDVYFDGRLAFSYETRDGNAPHYLLLNLGSNAGPEVFGEPGAVKIDYVRVWQ